MVYDAVVLYTRFETHEFVDRCGIESYCLFVEDRNRTKTTPFITLWLQCYNPTPR